MAGYIEDLERQYQNEVVTLFLETLKYKYLGNLQYTKGAKVNCLGKANYEAEHQVMAAEDLVEYHARPNFRDPASAHGVLFRKELRK